MNEVIKVSVYVFVDVISNMLLSYIPFQNYMRHNKYIFTATLASIYCISVACRIFALGHLGFAMAFSVILISVYLIFYRINFRVKFPKLLFVLLVILNYGSFVGIIHTYIANRLLAGFAKDQYSFGSSGVFFAIVAVSYPFLHHMMKYRIKPLISVDIDNQIWRFLWLIPATSCLSYYYSLFANGGLLEFSKNIQNVVFAVMLNMGSLLVTFIIARLVRESNESMLLKIDNYKLNLQNLQYENLQNRIEETRRARHDLRQIMTVILSFLEDENTERLKKYMNQYTKTLPADSPIIYCENYEVNALILYYADLCYKMEIPIAIQALYPKDCRVAEPDAVILLGNLLENAFEACARQIGTGKSSMPSITLHIKATEEKVIITLDNTYSGQIKESDKTFISSKNNREGIGLVTIKNVTARYNGVAKFEYNGKLFHSSILLLL